MLFTKIFSAIGVAFLILGLVVSIPQVIKDTNELFAFLIVYPLVSPFIFFGFYVWGSLIDWARHHIYRLPKPEGLLEKRILDVLTITIILFGYPILMFILVYHIFPTS